MLPMKVDYSYDSKKTLKTFHFTDEEDIIYLSCNSDDSLCSSNELHTCDHNCLNVKIKESLQTNYGVHVWPSAPVLGKYIWYNRWRLKDKTALELGTGTGLIAIVAAKCGASVLVTDVYDPVLKIASENLILNNCDNFKILKLEWGCFSPFLLSIGKVDIILGSDVFYDPNDFENLIATVSFVFKNNIHAEFWCAYEKRCSEWNIQQYLDKWDIVCEEIPLDRFGAEGTNVADSGFPGLKEIHLFKFSSKLSKNFIS